MTTLAAARWEKAHWWSNTERLYDGLGKEVAKVYSYDGTWCCVVENLPRTFWKTKAQAKEEAERSLMF
jgi:hypothetical protein